MDMLNQALACFAIVIMFLGLTWILVERLWLSAPVVALAAGVIVGPEGFKWVMPAEIGGHLLMEELTRITLALTVMSIALTLPYKYVFNKWKSMALLLLPGMLFMWMASTFILYATGIITFTVALLIGACLTPTDPVIASSIATGALAEKKIPARLRHLLKAESGANDGLAYFFLFLPILILSGHSIESSFKEWLTTVLLKEIMGAIAIGATVGFCAGKLQLVGERINITESTGLLTLALALTIATLTVGKLAGTNDILAVFVAGIAFHLVAHDKLEGAEAQFQDVIQRFFQIPVFVLLGAMLPWEKWGHVSLLSGCILITGIMLLRRLPAWLVLKRPTPELRFWSDSLFLGWFGPIGVSALFYACIAQRETGDEQVWILVTLIVASSTLLHGITSTPFSDLLHRYEKSINPQQK